MPRADAGLPDSISPCVIDNELNSQMSRARGAHMALENTWNSRDFQYPEWIGPRNGPASSDLVRCPNAIENEPPVRAGRGNSLSNSLCAHISARRPVQRRPTNFPSDPNGHQTLAHATTTRAFSAGIEGNTVRPTVLEGLDERGHEEVEDFWPRGRYTHRLVPRLRRGPGASTGWTHPQARGFRVPLRGLGEGATPR